MRCHGPTHKVAAVVVLREGGGDVFLGDRPDAMSVVHIRRSERLGLLVAALALVVLGSLTVLVEGERYRSPRTGRGIW